MTKKDRKEGDLEKEIHNFETLLLKVY